MSRMIGGIPDTLAYTLRTAASATAFFGAAAGIGGPAYAQGDAFFLTGIVYPIQDVELSLPTEGPVAEISVEEGQTVSAGDPLLRLDDRLQRLEVERRKRIWKDTSQIDTARQNLALLEELVATKEELFASTKTVSESELKRNQIQLNQARGEYAALVERESREEIEYRIGDQVLDSYNLTSPIDGRVVTIEPAAGEWVSSGKPVIRLINTRVCYLDINLEAETAFALAAEAKRSSDDNLIVALDILAGAETIRKTGRVGYVAPIVDAGSGLVQVKIFFDNADAAITPGVTGRLVR